MTEANTFAIQSPEEWKPLGVGEDDMDPQVVWVVASSALAAEYVYRAYVSADEEEAISMIRSGLLRGTLGEARELAVGKAGFPEIFRVVPREWTKERN